MVWLVALVIVAVPASASAAMSAWAGPSLTGVAGEASGGPLPDGRVLIAGGMSGWMRGTAVSTAQVYDPVSNALTATGSMADARSGAASVTLQDGRILVVGGFAPNNAPTPMASAEIYDPATGSFSPAGSLPVALAAPAATRLADGTVLVVGGQLTGGAYSSNAYLYDPATNQFTQTTGGPGTPLINTTATLLLSGKVLVAGGYDGGSSLGGAWLYDPATKTFSVTTGGMSTSRANPTATLLQNGKVLVAGGRTGQWLTEVATADVYDPSTGTFSATTNSMSAPRRSPAAARLADGTVLVAGGGSATTDVYDPSTDRFTSGPTMPRAHNQAVTALLPGGNVFIGGGASGGATTLIGTPPVALTVSVSGSGRVTSAPVGIDCGAACTAWMSPGSQVTLTATAEPGSTFAGWSGACTAIGASCTVTMSAARAVTANFAVVPEPTPEPDATPASPTGQIPTSVPAAAGTSVIPRTPATPRVRALRAAPTAPGGPVMVSGVVGTQGTLSVTGYTGVGRRAAQASRTAACRGSARVPMPGRASVRCALTPYGQRVLARGGALRLVVRFAPAFTGIPSVSTTWARMRPPRVLPAVTG